MWTFLERVDPDEHISRWYAVSVQPTLFGRVAVVRLWGSRESDFQQRKAQPYDDEGSARAAAGRLVQEKIRRGYRWVGGRKPPDVEEPATGDGERGEGESVGRCPLCQRRLKLAKTATGMILYCPDDCWQATGAEIADYWIAHDIGAWEQFAGDES
jgi:predicted DNA-binding WGR domain protein